MFDIGFWELAVIMIVALVVIGPDKLPGIARTAGKWVGKARYFVSNVKNDVQKELRAEELKQAIERDAGLDELKQIMNTDQFTLEEDDDPGYLVNAIDDDVVEQTKAFETTHSTDADADAHTETNTETHHDITPESTTAIPDEDTHPETNTQTDDKTNKSNT